MTYTKGKGKEIIFKVNVNKVSVGTLQAVWDAPLAMGMSRHKAMAAELLNCARLASRRARGAATTSTAPHHAAKKLPAGAKASIKQLAWDNFTLPS